MPPKKVFKDKGAENITPKVKEPSPPKEVATTIEENKAATEAP